MFGHVVSLRRTDTPSLDVKLPWCRNCLLITGLTSSIWLSPNRGRRKSQWRLTWHTHKASLYWWHKSTGIPFHPQNFTLNFPMLLQREIMHTTHAAEALWQNRALLFFFSQPGCLQHRTRLLVIFFPNCIRQKPQEIPQESSFFLFFTHDVLWIGSLHKDSVYSPEEGNIWSNDSSKIIFVVKCRCPSSLSSSC